MALVKIIIADTQYLIRKGLKALLADLPGVKVVAEAANKENLFTQLYSLRPDIVIIDHTNLESFRVDDINTINTISPETRILIISDIYNDILVQQVVESGITGFLTKTCDKNEIIEAVQAVAAGKKMFCHKVLDIILENPVRNSQNCEPAILSVREIEIIRLIANGYTTRQIATTLYRSFHTISTHRKNIMKKLGINSTSDLLMYAMNTGLIQPCGQITANH